jgi:hypothetical protein
MVVLLFETGARVSELMSLTLGDWNRRGLKDTAWARNKGSRKRRAKYVRFSEQTVKLLKKYFDLERKAVDVHYYTLDDYLRLAERHEIDLDAVPLFLSQRGTPWTVASFRAHYWKKACAAAKLDADIHQCRHWYVTQSLIEIHEQARKGELTVERGKEELIAYMRLPCRRKDAQCIQSLLSACEPRHCAKQRLQEAPRCADEATSNEEAAQVETDLGSIISCRATALSAGRGANTG